LDAADTIDELHQEPESRHVELAHYGRTPEFSGPSGLIDSRNRPDEGDGGGDDDGGGGEEVTITAAAAAARVERALLSVSGTPGGLGGLRVNLGLLSGLDAALFLERVTAGEAVAGGGPVGLLGAMAGGYNFNS